MTFDKVMVAVLNIVVGLTVITAVILGVMFILLLLFPLGFGTLIALGLVYLAHRVGNTIIDGYPLDESGRYEDFHD